MTEDEKAKILLVGGCEACKYYIFEEGTKKISISGNLFGDDDIKECTSIKYFNKMQADNPVFDTAVEGDEIGLPCSEDGYCENWELKDV